MNILVVEDAQDDAHLIQFMLAREGHAVELRTSGFADLIDEFDWASLNSILCDQSLDGYDGKDLFEWLKRNHPHVRRVMITGSSMTNEIQAHADKVLIKPVKPEGILEALGPTP